MSHLLSLLLLFVSLLVGILTHSAPVNAALPLTITNADVANVTNITALVSWQTNRESTTTATYSQSPCPCQQGAGDQPERIVTLHSVRLSGLTADRDYYVQPVSVDRDGVRADGPVIQFRTLRDTALPMIELSAVEVSAVSGTTATMTWKTSTAIRDGSGVEFETHPCPCTNNIQIDLGTATSHRVELAALEPNTTYYVRPFSYHPKDSSTIQYGVQKTLTTGSGTPARSSSTAIQLLSPNGGQQWNQGELHLLSWKATPGFVNTLRVALLNEKEERTLVLPQLSTEQRPSGNTALLLPSSLASGQYTLELANAANPDERDISDATLTIGTIPPPPPPAVQTPPIEAQPPTFGPAPVVTALPAPPITPPNEVKTTPTPALAPLPAIKKSASPSPKPLPKVKSAKGGSLPTGQAGASGGKLAPKKPKTKPKIKKKPVPKKVPVKK